MISVNLPMFPGFYSSMLDSEIDYTEEREAENFAEKDEEENENFPLESSDYSELIFDAMDYGAVHQTLARDWCASFAHRFKRETGIEFAYEFEEMTSPREYNFTTDKVFVKVAPRTLRAILRATPEEALREAIEERHSSRSGFISFYSNDYDEWREQGLTNWDYHQWGTVISAYCTAHGFDADDEAFSDMCDAGDFYSAFDEGMNWEKFEEARAEKRREREQAEQEEI